MEGRTEKEGERESAADDAEHDAHDLEIRVQAETKSPELTGF